MYYIYIYVYILDIDECIYKYRRSRPSSSVVVRPSFRTSCVRRHPPSFVPAVSSSVVRRPSSVVRRPSTVVRHPSSVVRYRPSSIVRGPSPKKAKY